jgi:type I restriction enzyme S subunit
MRKMRDSGIEWVGAMPRAWKMNTIAQIFLQVKCKNTRLQEKNLLSLSYGKVKRKSIDTVEGLLPESFDGYNIIEKDDIVLRLTDLQNDHTSLRVGLAEERGIITSAYLTIRNRSNFCPKYLYYYLHSFDIAKGFYGMGAGVRQGLNWDGVKWLKILAPSVPEQERIAAFLDAECAEIDAVLERTRASIEEYKKLKQAVITQAVTKGIRGDRPMKDSGIEWIGDIPAEWDVVPFSKFARVSANLVNPSDYQDYLQVSPENIEKDSGKLLPCKTVSEVGVESWNHFFHKGQILYSKIRPKLNKVCIAPFDGLCSADMYPIDTDNISKFVVYTILSNDFNQQVAMITENRVKMPKINQKELSKIIVVLPANRMEQQEIVDYLDGECGKIDALIAKKQQYLTEIENYKKSLIYEYVTGKKEVV